jgi:hypothetical protein
VDPIIADAESGLAAYLEDLLAVRRRGRGGLLSALLDVEAHGDRISPIVDLALLQRRGGRRAVALRQSGPAPSGWLAWLEGQVALSALLARFPYLGLAGEPVRRPTFTLRGLELLPVARCLLPESAVLTRVRSLGIDDGGVDG